MATSLQKTECKFGDKCYRRNPQHFIEFSHPFVEDLAVKINDGQVEDVMALELESLIIEQAECVAELISSGELVIEKTVDVDKTTGGRKRKRSGPDVEEIQAKDRSVLPKTFHTIADKIESSSPFNYFLSSINSTPETKKQPFSLTFSDMFDSSLGTLKESLQFNFLVELGWLLAQYCYHKAQRKPLLVIHGEDTEEMRGAPKLVPTMQTVRVKPKYSYGHHHTKMAILWYDDGGIRVVLHTGNLIESDWLDRTQGLWISPKCPSNGTAADSATGFKKDLLRYLKAYELTVLQPWIERIRMCDMSVINVFFIPSVPACHSGTDSGLWGHAYLASLLREHAVVDPQQASTIVMQCSSVGSLGPTADSWLTGQLANSMSQCNQGKPSATVADVKVVFPCFKDVSSSIHGVLGGGCLPYTRQGHSKQLWFTSFLHRWRSDKLLRTGAMPHIKTYARVNGDWSKLSWFVLSSANLSKAAWGLRARNGNLTIQAYEAGILFLPKFINRLDHFRATELTLPFDTPPTHYDPCDEPWFIDHLRS